MRRLITLTTAAILLLAACGDDDGGNVRTLDDSGSGSGTGHGTGSATGSATGTAAGPHCETVGDPTVAETTVTVVLEEWRVEADPAQADAGTIGFHAENQGVEPHELVIVEAESPGDLPVDGDGAVDESDLPEGSEIGEIEVFPPGEECDGAFPLEAGTYVLFCNYEDHFSQGMATTFEVS